MIGHDPGQFIIHIMSRYKRKCLGQLVCNMQSSHYNEIIKS